MNGLMKSFGKIDPASVWVMHDWERPHMNERIDNLLYQAGLTAQGCWDELGTYEQEAIEKFAELIVKECMEVVTKKCASPTAYNALAEHFGVE
jgi:hypothetical protein